MNKWDKRFMEMARLVATWTSCFAPGRAIGAVIVKDKRVMTTGYNGAPAGMKTCMEKGECLRRKLGIESGTRHEVCYAAHAEENAILFAGKNLSDCSIFVSGLPPCSHCASLIVQCGIKKVYAWKQEIPERWRDNVELTKKIFKEAGVTLEFIEKD